MDMHRMQLASKEIRATYVVKSLRIQSAAEVIEIIRKSKSQVFKPSQVRNLHTHTIRGSK